VVSGLRSLAVWCVCHVTDSARAAVPQPTAVGESVGQGRGGCGITRRAGPGRSWVITACWQPRRGAALGWVLSRQRGQLRPRIGYSHSPAGAVLEAWQKNPGMGVQQPYWSRRFWSIIRLAANEEKGIPIRVSAMLLAPDIGGLEPDDQEHDRVYLSTKVEGIKSIGCSIHQCVPSHHARHVACPMPTRAMRG
jgi:hypothetical protein